MLPAFALSLRPMAYFTRVTRAAMIDVLQAPYITAARSRGLGMTQTVLRHGLRNGAIPVVTLFALWLAGLLGGSVVVEVIFAVPGMGRLIYEAVLNKDLPVLQGGFVAIVALSVLINTLADIVYAVLNPAVRFGHVHADRPWTAPAFDARPRAAPALLLRAPSRFARTRHWTFSAGMRAVRRRSCSCSAWPMARAL